MRRLTRGSDEDQTRHRGQSVGGGGGLPKLRRTTVGEVKQNDDLGYYYDC